jgi:hypothetical protein
VSTPDAASVERVEVRYVAAAVVVVASFFFLQLLGGWIREVVSDEPSHLELVQTCLTERKVAFEPPSGDVVALSAERGALRASVEGNAVTIALGGSERDARRVYESYVSVAEPDLGARLERSRKVVFLWDAPPSSAQRDFVLLCTRDAQE